MKKRVLKIMVTMFAIAGLAVAGYVTLVLYPHPVFAYDTQVGPMGVLSDSPLEPEFVAAVEEAISIIATSELYSPDAPMGLILAHNHFYHSLSPGKQLAYSIGPYAILAGETDARTNTLHWEKSPVRMNLVAAIAHELTHSLQGHYYGYFSVRRSMFPWKLEAYAEYIAHQKTRAQEGYSLRASVDRLLDTEKVEPVEGWMTAADGFDYPIEYYRFQVMAEFLFDVEGINYDDFVNEVEFHDVYQRMIAWHNTQPEADT